MYFFVAMTKKVTIKKEFAVLPPPNPPESIRDKLSGGGHMQIRMTF